MCFHELKLKAAGLPMVPGVYIMRDINDTVIYVGKAKKLKNRVSQYFQDTGNHTIKTRTMVKAIDHFDVIVAASEFEALVLECSLIKRYLPKYNILLKDDKGYPYVRVNMKESYPQMSIVNKISDDGAAYYGPFGSRSVTQSLIDAIRLTLKLPGCSKLRVGKDRTCLNFHMNQCEGWCQEVKSADEYRARMEQAVQLLSGDFKVVTRQIKAQMLAASENLNFELAAGLRDRLKSVEALGQKQLVTAGKLADTDVIGFYQNETKACFTVLHFNKGNLLDKDYEILNAVDEPETAVASLLSQFYLSKGYSPKNIFLPFSLEDSVLFEQLLEQNFGRRPKLRVPQRGDNLHLVELAGINAQEEITRITTKEERTKSVLTLLSKMLALPKLHRIESFDISNTSGADIVGSMVVYIDGKAKKGDYKRFSIRDMDNQDDYASMHQVITRRFTHLNNGDRGFDSQPDMLLIDGGVTHAQTAVKALSELGLTIPTFGMVKDDRHRTRALVTPDGLEIRIDTQPSVFAFIGSIQEETHRFAIDYHRHLRSKRLHRSELDNIPGVGEKRKQELLKVFKSITAIRNAGIDELLRVVPANVAENIYVHFHEQDEG